MKGNYSPERGQVLVIIVFAMFGLIGIAGLAIDGSRAFTDRRQAQNAADTAALAAALANVRNNVDWATMGMDRAASNGYDNDGTTNTVTIHNPPINGLYSGDTEYVQIIITSNIETLLGRIVGIEQMSNTVQAVARVIPSVNTEIGFGNAMVGLAPSDCKAIKFQGSANATITGGGLFVNSDCADAAFFNNSAGGTLTAPSLTAVGGITYKEGALNVPSIETGAEAIAYPPNDIVLPNIACSGAATVAGDTMSPGNYSGTFPPAGVTTLESGAYCVDGDFKMNASDVLVGHDVVISMETGGITWNGGAEIKLDAPETGPYTGLLISFPITNSSGISINGNSDSAFAGTILAPASDIDIAGTGGAGGFNSQVIGYTVELSGTSDISINYNDAQNWDATTPPSIELIH